MMCRELCSRFFVQKGEKFSTFSTVKTVESTVKTVEWLIISTVFSTETLKNRLIPHENLSGKVENYVKTVENLFWKFP